LKYNYDTIAWCYDLLAGFMFGKKLRTLQASLASAVPAHATVLLVGGGTGWILEEMAKIHPSGLTIIYVDASEGMIRKAKARSYGDNKVSFVHGDIRDLDVGSVDVVFTPFLFDNFDDATAAAIFTRLHGSLAPGGIWLHADFENNGIRSHQLLLRVMYRFFRTASGIEASRLPNVTSLFSTHGYTIIKEYTAMRGFIRGTVFRK
jgi:ubiquinone/menaquinone biosynthesis C-methylase UbiE